MSEVSEVSTADKIKAIVINSLKSLVFPLCAILVAVFVSVFFVMWAKGYTITQYFSALNDLFSTIWKGSFGNTRKTYDTISYITPLIFTGIANAVAFKTGLFNVGAEGQFVIGMTAAAIVGLIPGLSPIIHLPLIILSGMVAGAIWAAVPGYLKARFGTNEVINTIMMNYIALNVANYVALRSVFSNKLQASTPQIQNSAMLPRFSEMSHGNVGIFIGIVCAIFIYWLLWKTTIGYEIRACGINALGAEYGGISKSKNIVLAMVLSGLLAGMGGAVHMSGVKHQLEDLMTSPGYGWDGMAVALLAKSNPIGCLVAAVLFGALNSSSKLLQINNIPKEIVYLIQSIIITFIATDYIVKYFSAKKKKGAIING